ncbi:uncharacterized protein [Dendropsophus ebraccatus]|uniref:uncharacterized protein n=1 Tax=Dendropsophus ebraccatus TaxID=150705 RepID=UPI003831BF90
MAESSDNAQEGGTSLICDKENQTNPPEHKQPTQPEQPSPEIRRPLQELCNVPTTSDVAENEGARHPAPQEPPGTKRNWLADLAAKIEEENKAKVTPSKRAKSSSAGKGRPSTSRKSHVKDVSSPDIEEETPENQESTESTKKKIKLEAATTEEKVCVSYKWSKQGIKRGRADPNTPIIDFVRQTSSRTKKSGYLFIYAKKLNAIVSPWAPCGALEEGEVLELDLRRMKSPNSSTIEREQVADKIVGPDEFRYDRFHDGRFIKVKWQGKTDKGQPRVIIHKTQFYADNNPMAVFGYPGQTVHEALHNDKRFTLCHQFSLKDSDYTTHNSNLLWSNLSDDTYTIVVEKRSDSINTISPIEDIQHNELDVTSTVPGTSGPQPEPCVDPPGLPVPIPSPLSPKFSNEYKKLAKTIGPKNLESQIVNDYQRNVWYKDAMTEATFRLLYQHLDNVALLRYNIGGGSETGTLFLLTETLGLTCHHVVKRLKESQPDGSVEALFTHKSEDNIVCGKCTEAVWFDEELDCSFVRVELPPSSSDYTPPSGLLGYLAPPPQDGAVTIIGHPGGEGKKIDPNCSVIAFSQRANSIFETMLCDRSYIHILTQHNFKPMSDPTLVTYDSCLYWGASGAPVFNDNGDLVAMHTGGYPISTTLKKKSVIEYGRSAVDIIIHGAAHIEELREPLRRLVIEKENLSKYLQPGGHQDKMQPAIRELHKLWGGSGTVKNPIADEEMMSQNSQE